ncbi:MAG: carboxylesterase/lipase family protein [Actinomycetota bacterium]|nr:carboxylesterase/lipase family protein [Actinomycetota bacterium]
MSSIVEIKEGSLQGVEDGEVIAFRGVPFARAPIGPLRFRPPQPAEPWSGVRVCDTFGFVAPQPQGQAMAGQGTPEEQSEDCLHLNVWTPACDDAARPVMVWIHGGAFVTGSGSGAFYRGQHLAARGDVVVVTINYRLGALGFLAHPDLLDEESGASGNWGLLDQVAALQWVQANITNFGGDPTNVTIFGESAGSMSVSCLVGSPSTQGLFRRAIAQSGGPNGVPMETATTTATQLCEAAGVPDVAALRDLDVAALLDAQTQLQAAAAESGSGMALAPTIDGGLLPEHPLTAIRNGVAKGKELLVGTNLHEMKLWVVGNRKLTGGDEEFILRRLEKTVGDGAADALAAYKAARADRGDDLTPIELWTAIESDRVFRLPSLRMCEAQSARGDTVFDYLFTWESPAMGGLLGACHALEIPFVFGTLTTPGIELFTGAGPEALALSEKMQDAWLAFARTGNPTTDALGYWPAYAAQRRATMVLGAETVIAEAPYEAERVHWDDKATGRFPED